jgi:antitoxin YefM
MNYIAISELRANLPDLIDQVSDKLDRLIVTVSGKPKAVVLSLEELESIEETAEILAIPGALESIKKSQKEIKEGKYVTLEELEKKYAGANSIKNCRK